MVHAYWLTDDDEIYPFGHWYQISIPDIFWYSVVLRQFGRYHKSIEVGYPALFTDLADKFQTTVAPSGLKQPLLDGWGKQQNVPNTEADMHKSHD